jgi:peptidyl-prolyl cis-trans isomerase A (cyclophilin A)
LALFFLTLAAAPCFGQTNGIFADFTTSMGNFTCQLSYSNAPAAVANFIGLATGERAWLDEATGEIRSDPFYDGLIFHRVITNFVIQAGSPNGLGSGGPGYVFVDEFSPQLDFSTPWTLAMANSGPDSNGSQFFITVAPYTDGNNRYVVFGRVISGTDVVSAIDLVATDANNKPLTPVIIRQVTIRREGAAALAFDIGAHGLPLVEQLPAKIEVATGEASLTFSNSPYTDNRWYSTTNLSAWVENKLGIELAIPDTNAVQLALDSPAKFFRFARIEYPSSTFTPKNVLGRTLILRFAGGITNAIVFNTVGGGSYTLTGSTSSSGTVISYNWLQHPYDGFLNPINYSGWWQMGLQLNFSSGTNGSFSGSAYIPTSPPSLLPVSGTFDLSGG